MKNFSKPTVKDILKIIAVSGVVSASLIFPGLPMAANKILTIKRQQEIAKQKKIFKKYNQNLLRHNLRRIQYQKEVEIINQDNEFIIRLTEKGKKKIIRYKLEELFDKKKDWDKKWRLIIYDIPDWKKSHRERFRKVIKKWKLYPLQESAYLTPFECKEEIEYLRQLFGIGSEVMYLTILKLENDQVYRDYFGL